MKVVTVVVHKLNTNNINAWSRSHRPAMSDQTKVTKRKGYMSEEESGYVVLCICEGVPGHVCSCDCCIGSNKERVGRWAFLLTQGLRYVALWFFSIQYTAILYF